MKRQIKVTVTFLLSAFLLANLCMAQTSYSSMEYELDDYVKGKNCDFGIAVIVDGNEVISLNGMRKYPMLSVYKFPQAVSVIDYCLMKQMSVSDSVDIMAEELKENTYSPMLKRYGKKNLRLPISELLEYSVAQSDNNACDILFRIIGGVKVSDDYIKSLNIHDIEIKYTEDEMHRDVNLCYDNSSTPLDMARFVELFHTDLRYRSGEMNFLSEIMEKCQTGTDRLPAPFGGTEVVCGHKTGTGDKNDKGEIIGINDVGYVYLPDGRRYVIVVFIRDSHYDMATTSRFIGDISSIVYRNILKMDN